MAFSLEALRLGNDTGLFTAIFENFGGTDSQLTY
jgi:hypothetical protein